MSWYDRHRKKPVYENARMTTGTLAAFLYGLDWSEIKALCPSTPMGWWRGAIVREEEAGNLAWVAGMWMLTDQGREAIRDVA